MLFGGTFWAGAGGTGRAPVPLSCGDDFCMPPFCAALGGQLFSLTGLAALGPLGSALVPLRASASCFSFSSSCFISSSSLVSSSCSCHSCCAAFCLYFA